MADEAISLTARENRIFESLKSQHAYDTAVLQNKVRVLEGNEATHKNNHRQLTERVVELQTKLLAAQERIVELQDRLLELRQLVNAP